MDSGPDMERESESGERGGAHLVRCGGGVCLVLSVKLYGLIFKKSKFSIKGECHVLRGVWFIRVQIRLIQPTRRSP